MEKNDDIRFTNFLRGKAAEAKRELGYQPNFFLGMLESEGGYKTVLKLLAAREVSEGFTKLWEYRRLDLSVEALIVESEWRRAFDEELLKRAEKKLKAAGYQYVAFPASSA